MVQVTLDVPTAEPFVPLLEPARYKGAKGGRSSGKSHFFAEAAVIEMVCDPSLRFVCIREVQRSLKFSAKSLVEHKIKALGLEEQFEVLSTEIRRRGGDGVMIFEGMQDHTADSLKSLEGFRLAWVEEAQRLSQRSIDLLLPTIMRSKGAEIWFSWNPEQRDDPVDAFFQDLAGDDFPLDSGHAAGEDYSLVHANYKDNPFNPEEAEALAARTLRTDPDAYAHIWLGRYNLKSTVQVLTGKWRIDEYEPGADWDGPYYGADWGFSQDPTVLVRFWIYANRLWIEYETGGTAWDNDRTAREFRELPGAKRHVIRADNARPETINEMRKRGLDCQPADKWKGSVEDGIAFLRSFEEIVIHERCTRAQEEARLWSYKTDRLTGDPLPKLAPGHDHIWDAVRYGLAPLIHESGFEFWVR